MNQQGMAEFLVGMIVCIVVLIAIALVIHILFLLNLHRTVAAVREENRELSPGMVWLSLIPFVNLIWNVIMVPKISNSLRKEFEDREWSTTNEGFARTTGMVWAWGNVASTVVSIVQNVAQAADVKPMAMVLGLVNCPIGLAVLVCWIMFWVQTYQYRKRLTEGGDGYREGSVEDDYDDRRRPRLDEDEHGRPGKDDRDRDDDFRRDDEPRRDRDDY